MSNRTIDNYNDRIDKRVSLIITLQVVLLGCKNVLVQGLPLLFSINEKLNIVILGLVTPLYVYSFLILRKRKVCKDAIFFSWLIVLTIIFTIIVFPQNVEYIKVYALRTIVVLFMTSMLLVKLTTFDYIQKYMLKGSYLMTLSCVAYAAAIIVIGHTVNSEWSNYSMVMSYSALWAVMWQLHAYFKYNNLIALAFAIVGFLIIFMYGSRNPLLAIFAYVIVLILDKMNNNRSKASRVFFLFSMGLLLLAGAFWRPILMFVAGMLDHFGISGRIVYTLLNSESTDDLTTGRSSIHDEIINVIFEHPFFGVGICGDEATIGELSHSLYLNIFSTWGLFIGLLVLLAIIRCCIVGLRNSQGLEHQILIMFMCIVFPRGFSGGDMWSSDVFWWLIGIVFMIMSHKYRRLNSIKLSI